MQELVDGYIIEDLEELGDNMIENGIYESFEEIDTDERIFIRKLK